MDNPVRIALIGFGTMGQGYAKMLTSGLVPELKLVGICCRNTAGRELAGREYPDVKVYPSQQAMEDDEKAYDAVLIVTPHTSHVAIGRAFAALGKHILMDKPAGIDAGSVRELCDHCRSHGVSYGMIFQNRRLPAFRKAKEILESGALGSLHRAVWVCNNWYRSPAYHRSGTWRSSWNGECGGLMINQNPHYMDIWNWFFGLPDRIFADMQFGRYNDFLVDDGVDIQFSYGNGFHGTMVSATGEAPGVNRLEIWGSKGKMTLVDGVRLILDENQVSTEEFGRTNSVPFATIPHEEREIPLEAPGIPYVDVFRNFADHILHGAPLFASGEDGLKEVELANAVYVSGWEERKVALPVENEHYLSGLEQRQRMENV